jgi:hypothetical protein
MARDHDGICGMKSRAAGQAETVCKYQLSSSAIQRRCHADFFQSRRDEYRTPAAVSAISLT